VFQLSFLFSSFLPLFSLSVPLPSLPFPLYQLGVWHRRRYAKNFWLGKIPPSTSSSLPFTFSSLFLSTLSILFEVDSSNTAKDLGSDVSSSSGVWGGAPAESEFGAFSLKI